MAGLTWIRTLSRCIQRLADGVLLQRGVPWRGSYARRLSRDACSDLNQNNGVNAAIIFQATRVSTIAAVNGGAAPDYTNQLDTIHINNWDEVNELNFAEFATGCCTPIDKTLSVEFTVDHEQMGAGSWSLEISSCALPSDIGLIDIPPAPSPIAGVTFTAAGRGGSGTIVEDTSQWPNCSYTGVAYHQTRTYHRLNRPG